MKSKVIKVLLRRPSTAGDYSCPDGELEKTEGFTTDTGSNSSGQPGEPGNPGATGTTGGEFTPIAPPPAVFFLTRSVVPGWHNHPDNPPAMDAEVSDPSERTWSRKALECLRLLEKSAAGAGLFIEPFLAICAYRQKNGTYVAPSAPVLLIPNRESPFVRAGTDFTATSMSLAAEISACRLRMKLTSPPDTGNRSGSITHLDIFISTPLTLWKRDGEMTLTRIHSGQSTRQGWKPEAPEPFEMRRCLESLSTFRHVASISIDSVPLDFVDVVFNCASISRLDDAETFIPDFAMGHLVGYGSSQRISGRDTICDLRMRLSAPAHIRNLMPAPENNGTSPVNTALEVEAVKHGEIIRASRSGGERIPFSSGSFPHFLFYPDPDATCLTIVSETETCRVALRRHPGLHGAYFWSGDLTAPTPAEMGVATSGSGIPGGDIAESLSEPEYAMPEAVWRSVKGSGEIFPDSLLMTLDVERAIAVTRAFRSSGLVATTSPTAYAFTSEGIFLLKEADDGTFRDAGLISRDILRDSGSFRSEGRILEFTTTDGRVLRIEGTTVKDTSASGSAGSSSETAKSVVILKAPKGETASFITRPMKLGDAEEIKHITAVELRGRVEPKAVTVNLYGSTDLIRWRLLASGGGRLRGLWGPGVRYAKAECVTTGNEPVEVEAIAVTVMVKTAKKD